MDRLYSYDEAKLDGIRANKLWTLDPRYFKRVKISPSAAVKMISHGQSGVDKGIKAGGKPVEVMGFLLGRPDDEDLNCMIVTDAQALPIEGFETRVVADDQNVVNFMISLSENNELSTKETFCGWYHTHPFDVDENSHCYLSSTDVSTQLLWQRSEDPRGNPWLAIVIDPLRSLAKNRPELMAFRVYPPEYAGPANQTPDGTLITDDNKRLRLWGSCWERYYRLEVSYFMSDLAQNTLGILKNNFLWSSTFTDAPSRELEHQQRLAERTSELASTFQTLRSAGSHTFGRGGGLEHTVGGGEAVRGAGRQEGPLTKAVQSGAGLAVETCECCMSNIAKKLIFATNLRRAQQGSEAANPTQEDMLI